MEHVMSPNRFGRLLSLKTWLSKTLRLTGINYIDSFNLFWGSSYLFWSDGLHTSRSGVKALVGYFWVQPATPIGPA